MTTVRDVIQRDLDEDIQSVIKVAEEDRLTTDLREYVLTDDLAKQFADVFSATVAAARPASGNLTKVGIWVSGFFGSGKSHFSKLIGHLAADTETPAGTAREPLQAATHSRQPKTRRSCRAPPGSRELRAARLRRPVRYHSHVWRRHRQSCTYRPARIPGEAWPLVADPLRRPRARAHRSGQVRAAPQGLSSP